MNKRLYLFLLSLLAVSCFCFGQEEAQVTTLSQGSADTKYSLKGKIINELGNPLADVNIEIFSPEKPEQLCKTTTDNLGVFTMAVPKLPGKCRLRATTTYCGTVIRDYENSTQLQNVKALDITMICYDPPLPIQLKEHKKNPGGTYHKYLGAYQVTFICKGEKQDGGTIVFQGLHKSLKGKCNCSDASRVFSWVGACGEFGCWHVDDDGDIMMSFPCGAIFAGEKFTLWEEGEQLVGYGSSWSDTGGGKNREIFLAPIKNSPLYTAYYPLEIQLIYGKNKAVGRGFVEIRKNPDDKVPIISGHSDYWGIFEYPQRPNLDKVFIRVSTCSFGVIEVEAKLPQEVITIQLEKEEPFSEICKIKPDTSTATLCVRVRSEECFPLYEAQLELTNNGNGDVKKKSADKNGVAVFYNILPGPSYKLVIEAPGYCKVVKNYPDLKAGKVEFVELNPCTANTTGAIM